MKNKTLLAIAIAVAAFTVFAPERRYILPNGQAVLEKELPSLGYVLFQGQWYNAIQLNLVMKQSKTASDWQSIIDQGTELYTNGKSAFEELKRLFGKKATLPEEDDFFGLDPDDIDGD